MSLVKICYSAKWLYLISRERLSKRGGVTKGDRLICLVIYQTNKTFHSVLEWCSIQIILHTQVNILKVDLDQLKACEAPVCWFNTQQIWPLNHSWKWVFSSKNLLFIRLLNFIEKGLLKKFCKKNSPSNMVEKTKETTKYIFRMAAPAANPIAEPPSFVNSKSSLNHPTKILSSPYSRC